MADSKISALPAATTPLVGTEVLPVVQGGTTDKVSVENLTAGRAVSGLNFTVTGSTIPTNGMYLPAANTLGFATNGVQQFRVGNVASAVNFLTVFGAAAGSGTNIVATGSDSNITANYTSKGSGSHTFYTNNAAQLQFNVAHTASAVNYFQVTGAATGSSPWIQTTGTDANINFRYSTKGSGSHNFQTGGGTEVTQFLVAHTASAVNYLQVTGGATGAPIAVRGIGEAGVGIAFDSGGTGWLRFCTSGSQLNQFVVVHTPSAANWVQTTGGATGNPVSLGATGNDTNVTTRFYSKGTGSVETWTNNQAQLQFAVTHTASAVNYIQASGSATGNKPGFTTAGSDTNVAMYLATKGSGTIDFVTNGSVQATIQALGSAVNYLQFIGGVASGTPVISVAGSDTNINMQYATKGTGVHRFITSTGDTAAIRAERTAATATYIDLAAINGGVAVRAGGAYNINVQTAGTTTQAVITHTASAVNTVVMSGGPTGNNPVLYADGSDANIGLNIWSKGTGTIAFATNSSSTNRQFAVSHVASAVNYVVAQGAATGGRTYLYPAGSDTDIGMGFAAKGAGTMIFQTGGGTLTQFVIGHTASAVNYWQANGGATADNVYLGAQGSDANPGVVLYTKGAGGFFVKTAANTLVQFAVSHTASAVNYLQVTGGATGSAPYILPQGSDANIALTISSKGGGNLNFYTGTTTEIQFQVLRTASTVNFVSVTGGATGNGVAVAAGGTDSNIDLRLTPKGTGVVDINGTAASASTATCNRTVPVKINGTTLYLMLSTTA